MKKYIFVLAILTVALTSCLKDKPDVDFSNLGANIELVESGLGYFSSDAITDAGPTITRTMTVYLSSPSTLSNDVTVSVGVDNTVIPTYLKTNSTIPYVALPTGSYTFPTQNVIIKAGTRFTKVTLTIDKSQLDPSLSYLLPVKILSTSTGTISGNLGIHYYHFIGNDFAGTYKYDYTRTPASGNFTGHTATFSPINPTQFETISSYYTAKERYEVTFTRTVVNGIVMYSNFNVIINSDDVTNIFTANSISITSQPKIVAAGYDANKSYTYAQAITLFDFQYEVLGSSGARVVEDHFYK